MKNDETMSVVDPAAFAAALAMDRDGHEKVTHTLLDAVSTLLSSLTIVSDPVAEDFPKPVIFFP